MTTTNFPRLVSDIGGTNARFSIEVSPYNYQDTQILKCENYLSLSSAISFYLNSVANKDVKHAALAVPSPIVDDTLFMVNNPWHLPSMSETKKDIGFETLIFLNDFHALALSIPHIPKNKLVQIGGIKTNPDKPISIIGPGTGLGMATLVPNPANGEFIAIPAEGGRSSFAPVTEEEFELWKFVHKRFHHVSAERFLSGPGLQLIYEAVASIHGILIEHMPEPHEISQKAIAGEFLAKQSLDHFCRILGTTASNLACMTNAFGGVYIGGGIIPRIIDYFAASDFRCRFEDKGRYRKYLETIPVYVITHNLPAMLGSSYALDTYLKYNYIP